MNRPRLGFILPAKIFKAVDFPIPFVPTKPSTCPVLGVGNLCSLNEFGPYLCVVSFSKFLGRLMMFRASNGHFFTQIPHPMQRSSEMYAIFDVPPTSMHIFPIFTTGHAFLHSCLHFFGLHRSALIMAMRSKRSAGDSSPDFFLGGMVACVLVCWCGGIRPIRAPRLTRLGGSQKSRTCSLTNYYTCRGSPVAGHRSVGAETRVRELTRVPRCSRCRGREGGKEGAVCLAAKWQPQ